jgi:hypothetical protein
MYLWVSYFVRLSEQTVISINSIYQSVFVIAMRCALREIGIEHSASKYCVRTCPPPAEWIPFERPSIFDFVGLQPMMQSKQLR